MTRALAVIDGEHYPEVVRDALAELPYEFVAALLVGGTEKLRGAADYGVPVVASLDEALAAHQPEIVLDLSDEPVLGPRERLALASRVLSHGLPYAGADFRFDPPAFAPYAPPSLAIGGTGKRVGKTAVTAHTARLLARTRTVVAVAMGRGGPAEPEVVTAAPVLDDLLALSRSGRHAASDHLELALVAGVPTVGCRRCGGGLAGAVATSNIEAGARIAAALDPDLVLFDGSGAAWPPIAARRRVLVVGAHQPPEVAAGYLNAYRLLLADLVVVAMAEERSGWERVRDSLIVRGGVPVVPVVLRPRPLASVAGRRSAFFSAAPPEALPRLVEHLTTVHRADVVHASGSLADREALRRELAGLDADVWLVELKAAAVDVVAEAARERGAEVVLCAVDVEPLQGYDLDAELLRLAEEACS